MTEPDITLRDATVIDGTGAPWFDGDVSITNNTITSVGQEPADAPVEIDASEKVVAPGFIDIHTHSDYTLPANRDAHSKVRQGVTLEIVGNCGSSTAPRYGDAAAAVDGGFSYRGLDGVVDTTHWESMAEYLDFLEKDGISLNVGSLVGHKNARAAVIGYDDREPTVEELEEMKTIVDEALADGAVGLSTGLIYTPGAFAKTDEIVELAKVAADHGKLYTTHMRSEGDDLIEATEEAIEIGRRADVKVQISHHKAVGESNWGKIRYTIRMMELARERGVDVQCEQYPYIASSTSLSARLPNWTKDGGTEALLERLRDPETREKIREELTERSGSWHDILVTNVQNPELEHLQGHSIGELAEREAEDRSPEELLIDILIEDRSRTKHVNFCMSERDVEEVMQHPLTMIGSDGSSMQPEGPLGEGVPHPRSYGTFPRVLGHYVREQGVLSLEEAVYKMTGQPAARLGLSDRGLVKEGMKADLTVFDPETVEQGGSFVEPDVYPNGIEYVMVNGKIVIEEEEHTGARPGVTIR